MRNSKPILLVEDDVVDAMTVKRALDDLKVPNPLVTRSNGEEALEYLRDGNGKKPCVILLDLNMPKMDGFEASRIIRSPGSGVLNPNIPIVAMTAMAMKGDREQCMAAGMNDYLTKPIEPHKLFELLNKYLNVF